MPRSLGSSLLQPHFTTVACLSKHEKMVAASGRQNLTSSLLLPHWLWASKHCDWNITSWSTLSFHPQSRRPRGPGHQTSTWSFWASGMLLNILFILVWWNAQCTSTNSTNIDWIVTAVSRQPLHYHHILEVALELVNGGKACRLLTALIIHKYNLCSPRHLKVLVMIVTADMNMYEGIKSTYFTYSIWVNIRLVSHVQNLSTGTSNN